MKHGCIGKIASFSYIKQLLPLPLDHHGSTRLFRILPHHENLYLLIFLVLSTESWLIALICHNRLLRHQRIAQITQAIQSQLL